MAKQAGVGSTLKVRLGGKAGQRSGSMAAPGAVMPDPKQIAYRRLDTARLYPWVEDPLDMDT